MFVWISAIFFVFKVHNLKVNQISLSEYGVEHHEGKRLVDYLTAESRKECKEILDTNDQFIFVISKVYHHRITTDCLTPMNKH